MKAWKLSIKNDDDQGQAIVFAENRSEAKKRLFCTDLEANCWTDIEARRYPDLDDMEEAEEVEIALIMWINGWRWFDYNTPDPVETSFDEFREWYNKTIREVQG